MEKKEFKVELLLDITISAVKKGVQYCGKMVGLGAPLKFDIKFNLPLATLEGYVCLGEFFGISSKNIAAGLERMLKNKYELKITRENDEPLDGMDPSEVNSILFQPIATAMSLLDNKKGSKEGTFRVPCLAPEEMEQFQNPAELHQYIISLNK